MFRGWKNVGDGVRRLSAPEEWGRRRIGEWDPATFSAGGEWGRRRIGEWDPATFSAGGNGDGRQMRWGR